MRSWVLSFLLWSLGLLLAPGLRAQEDLNPSSIDSGAAELCSKVFQYSWLPYQELARFLPKNFQEIPQLPTHRALNFKPEVCLTDPSIHLLIQKALSFHSKKIAFLLPLSQWPAPVAQAVKDHIVQVSERLGLKPQKNILWIDTGGDLQRLQTALAQLVFQQHVTLLVGGLHQNEAPILAQWGERLRIPTIILNRRAKLPNSPHVFAMAPDHEAMAIRLLQQMKQRSIKRVAVLMSQASREGYFFEALQRSAKTFGVEWVGPYLYVPSDYASIDSHLRQLLHLDDKSRDAEKLALLKKLQEKAKAESLPYEGGEITLPPQLDVDGLLIIDHFKSVRHISKALAAYQVKKLPLFGIPKWRALELIDPPDPLLKGGNFVDYIGSYSKLPYGIQATLVQGEYLIAGQEAGIVDLKLLTSHALYAAHQIALSDQTPRFQLYQALARTKNQNQQFFPKAEIFRPGNIAIWPTFLFTLEEEQIQLLP